MLRPRALRSGDRVAVIAPASPFSRTEFDAGVAEIARLGFEPVFDDRVFARESLVAGSGELRAASFRDALRDPSIRALIAVRGGYGSIEILPWLDTGELRDARKIICGYSDITSLLIYAVCHAGLAAFHGPMLDRRLSRGAEGYDVASFLNAVTRPEPMGKLQPDELAVLAPGRARGMLVGGTLTQLVSALGTSYAIRLNGPSILFIEDVGERPYRLRRMLTQLRLAGAFEHVTGVLLGAMSACDEPDGGPAACDTVRATLVDGGFGGPIVAGFPSGHTAGPLWTLPVGVTATLSSEDGGSVTIEEAAVDAA